VKGGGIDNEELRGTSCCVTLKFKKKLKLQKTQKTLTQKPHKNSKQVIQAVSGEKIPPCTYTPHTCLHQLHHHP